jgi:tRNA (guanine10-N2)-dimethyltransferase
MVTGDGLATDILLRLSAEHPSLPALEAQGLFGAIDPRVRVEALDQNLLLAHFAIDPPGPEAAARRLALTREASRVLEIARGSMVPVEPPLLEEIRGVSFVVRARGFGSESREVERELGRRILQEAHRSGIPTAVSVKSPAAVLRVERLKGSLVLSRLIPKPRRSTYGARARSRPFKRPVSLDPALARAMVNMCGLLPGESLLDPFCGTGTILSEAGIVGGAVTGIDADERMIAGARLNLSRVRPNLVRGDALRAPSLLKVSFDHIVTDPPYGRASARWTTRAAKGGFLSSLPRIFASLLGSGGNACFASPSTADLTDALADAGLRLDAFAYQRIHGSLGRHLYLVRAA